MARREGARVCGLDRTAVRAASVHIDRAYWGPMLAFKQALTDHGFIVGQTIRFEAQWAEDDFERLPALVKELVHRMTQVNRSLAAAAA
jgi:hypothetical protein